VRSLFASLTLLVVAMAAPVAAAQKIHLSVDVSKSGAKIDRNLFGQFAEHLGHGVYEGIWVGPDSKIPNTRGIRNDVVAALKALKVPDVRWPGGCFADEYHWRKGIGPQRTVTLNPNWGGVIEPNTFGTNEFMDFLDLQKQFPLNTMLNHYWLPVVRAHLEIRDGRPAQALKLLEDAAPYDLAFPQPQFSEGGLLYPPYVRGQAYLALRQGQQAAAEFQKFLDHRTIVQNSPLATLARLQLARAYVLQSDSAKARAAYQDFLTLWKDADPDIPILKQAKAEYAKLQ